MKAKDPFTVIADPTRRHILSMLAKKGKLNATQICRQFEVTPSAISQHLKVLQLAHLITVEKNAQQRLYQVNPTGIREIEGWAKNILSLWEDRFDALEAYVTKLKKTNYKESKK